VVVCGTEGAIGSRGLVARVKNPANAHGRRRLDGAAVQAYGVCGRVVRRNEQQLVGAFECTWE
jgi:hypothetical protein